MISLSKILPAFLLLMLVLSVNTHCQILRKISFEPMVGTGMALARIIPQPLSEQSNNPIQSKASVDGGWTILGGSYLKFRLNERLQIKTGVLFQIERFDYKLEGLVFGTDIDPSGGGYVSTSTTEGAIGLHRWSIPLLVDYYWQKDTYHLIVGISYLSAKRDFSHHQVTYYGNGDVEFFDTQPNKITEPYTQSIGATFGIGRKFCIESPHPALLIRVLGYYDLIGPNAMTFFFKGRHSPLFSLEVGYEF